jgi:hypothetical protein
VRFMLLFVGLAAAPESTDQQTADYNRQWGEWMGSLAASGSLEAGAPFQPSGSVVSSSGVEALELQRMDIGGFALIEADSEQLAVAAANRAPHTALGGRTIIRPLIELGS